MIRTAHVILIAFFIVIMVWSSAARCDGLQLFDDQTSAQQHCPSDTIVWLNLPTGIYHFQGERWYGATKHGAFVCRGEADAAGDRATENGQ